MNGSAFEFLEYFRYCVTGNLAALGSKLIRILSSGGLGGLPCGSTFDVLAKSNENECW